MSDLKLRELERLWRETLSMEDEIAYLRERLRVGDLTLQRLQLAAHSGHDAARAACGSRSARPRPGPPVDWTLLEASEEIEWYRETQRLGGDEALLRVVVAVFNRSRNAHDRPVSPHSLLFQQLCSVPPESRHSCSQESLVRWLVVAQDA